MALPFPILTAEEAAEMIQNGQSIGFSGFTAAGAAKAVPFALAQKAKREHEAGRPFKVGVMTGASTGRVQLSSGPSDAVGMATAGTA